ncbi:MAG: hypothetical protein RR400_04265 [Clostridia bacterium]
MTAAQKINELIADDFFTKTNIETYIHEIDGLGLTGFEIKGCDQQEFVENSFGASSKKQIVFAGETDEKEKEIVLCKLAIEKMLASNKENLNKIIDSNFLSNLEIDKLIKKQILLAITKKVIDKNELCTQYPQKISSLLSGIMEEYSNGSSAVLEKVLESNFRASLPRAKDNREEFYKIKSDLIVSSFYKRNFEPMHAILIKSTFNSTVCGDLAVKNLLNIEVIHGSSIFKSLSPINKFRLLKIRKKYMEEKNDSAYDLKVSNFLTSIENEKTTKKEGI